MGGWNRIALYHDCHGQRIEGIGESQFLRALRRDVQIRQDQIDVAGLRGGDDGTVIVDLEFNICIQPCGKAISQLYVITVQFCADIITERRHGSEVPNVR